MQNENSFTISREKHLDHMVKVVPFIVFCYAFQCFIILKVSPTQFSTISLSILGGFIALMISGFIFYDLKHRVYFGESGLKISFFKETNISYEDIILILVNDPGQTFSNLTLITEKGKYTFHFIDNADKIKSIIESKKHIELKAA
jgi:hypothetical protein